MRALDRADLAPPHVPMRLRREIAAIPQCEQQTARRIDDSSDRADDALVQFPIAAACDSHRPDETQPFAAIAKIGRAPCRERVWQYVSIWVGAESIKKKKQK